MFVAWIWALKVSWFILDLFGHPMTAHFGIPMSIPAHSQKKLICLIVFVRSDVTLFATTVRSLAYVVEFIVILDVQMCIHFFLFVAILIVVLGI